ncbi:type II toxin-antitoxin system death-on-curing family toxin [Nocardioides marmorisolisilvae]|uniref:Type II toxin-antitoxin system death-on-curing family toxin n=1 Tax=Nocardioides marmorisolisilvae TaxID=1542737 RepID=A0A3N0DZ71_9ACTN|nr:type II toxin-antitoxin system death-on-curing family toxin [Nocardioides marmorisolisilvae]RNL80897.1 type II toxin-antitoxin system death-on-curing family toxin [Nocardioides marmorisolisilvae]
MTSVQYLSLPELVHTAERAVGPIVIKDVGLLESALARPRATAFGEDAYRTFAEKAAALTHSLAKNHALLDGNKRLALSGLIAFLGINGRRLTIDNDAAYDLIIDIVDGRLADVPAIAEWIQRSTESHSF